MELLVVAAVVISAVGGVFGMLMALPYGTWEFEFAGRTISIKNYAARETIAVDGVVQKSTRTPTTRPRSSASSRRSGSCTSQRPAAPPTPRWTRSTMSSTGSMPTRRSRSRSDDDAPPRR